MIKDNYPPFFAPIHLVSSGSLFLRIVLAGQKWWDLLSVCVERLGYCYKEHFCSGLVMKRGIKLQLFWISAVRFPTTVSAKPLPMCAFSVLLPFLSTKYSLRGLSLYSKSTQWSHWARDAHGAHSLSSPFLASSYINLSRVRADFCVDLNFQKFMRISDSWWK